MRLKDKVSIITGGGGGIGRAIAKGFLEEESTVVMVDTNRAGKQKAVRDILRLYKKKAYFIEADVSISIEVNRMADEVFERFNKIDVLVNCAGIYEDRFMLDMSDEEWDKTMKVNLYGCFFCSRAAADYMKQENGGSIINISSIGGQKAPSIGHSHYAASKAGMIGFTRAIASELALFGIRVNNICPGVTEDTPMGDRAIKNVGKEYFKNVPLGRPAVPLDIAYGAIYLASDESDYITGATLSINGGMYMD